MDGRWPGRDLNLVCLGNPTGRGARWATVHGAEKESNTTAIRQLRAKCLLSIVSPAFLTLLVTFFSHLYIERVGL